VTQRLLTLLLCVSLCLLLCRWTVVMVGGNCSGVADSHEVLTARGGPLRCAAAVGWLTRLLYVTCCYLERYLVETLKWLLLLLLHSGLLFSACPAAAAAAAFSCHPRCS
jgi:hypothetical protein